MALSFLVSYKILHNAFNSKIPSSDSVVTSKQTLDIIGELYGKYDTFSLWATSQAIDKICGELDLSQATRLKASFQSENKTQGVKDGFNADTSTSESAKALSYKGVCIVISEQSEIDTIYTNKRIKVTTPSEFILSYKKAQMLLKILPIEEKISDLLILMLFKPEMCDTISAQIEKNKKE